MLLVQCSRTSVPRLSGQITSTAPSHDNCTQFLGRHCSVETEPRADNDSIPTHECSPGRTVRGRLQWQRTTDYRSFTDEKQERNEDTSGAMELHAPGWNPVRDSDAQHRRKYACGSDWQAGHNLWGEEGKQGHGNSHHIFDSRGNFHKQYRHQREATDERTITRRWQHVHEWRPPLPTWIHSPCKHATKPNEKKEAQDGERRPDIPRQDEKQTSEQNTSNTQNRCAQPLSHTNKRCHTHIK